MAKAIVIVESPTKVKTINKFLGRKFKVTSSMGHLIDLPKSTLGVDVENNFEPKFIAVRSKSKILTKLKKDVKNVDEIYVATDPDREGEAIGWNLVQHIGEGKKIFRVSFQEITKEAVLKAFKSPREFQMNVIDAQIGRRILDRIVGYKLSPVLWKKIGSRLSAGRVQSVALRIIIEREREHLSFKPVEYWKLAVDLKKPAVDAILLANLDKIEKKKAEIGSQDMMDEIVSDLKKEDFIVTKISEREVQRKPQAPLITSTLQQEGFNKCRFNANRTMRLAQQLYEGINLGGETVGLITYMRTDSVNISNEAMGKVREHIGDKYGDKYLPSKPNVFKSKKSAQEAHEAIRPSDVSLTPSSIRQYLEDDQFKVYQLIWNRFVSSQMVAAIYKYKKMEVGAGKYLFGATGSTLMFAGYLVLDRSSQEEEAKVDFSSYEKGDKLDALKFKPTQHFTKPPPRFSDASVVKALEEYGIGRPSTYASIISTLMMRNYINRDRGYLKPTELGFKVCDLLIEYFPVVLDVGFTASMEEKLDEVEDGNLKYPELLKEFWIPFEKELKHAEETIVKTQNFVDKNCPECQAKMVVKWGRRGKFLSCSAFPECRHAEPFTIGIKCPEENCEGELVRRKSKKGMSFFGCSKFPDCTHITQNLPKDGESPVPNAKKEDSKA